MMADIIDRQAAIDAICNTGCYDFGYSCDLCVSKAALESVPGYAKPFNTAISWREAMNAVKSLPCVTDEQGNVWILRADVEAKLTVMADVPPEKGK